MVRHKSRAHRLWGVRWRPLVPSLHGQRIPLSRQSEDIKSRGVYVRVILRVQ